MKFALVFAVLAVASNAFAPSPLKASRSSTLLCSARVDSSEAVKAALEASKKFGPTSKEARVAWEMVEEIDSSDNSNAYKGGVSDDECLTSEIEACQDYNEKLVELSRLIEDVGPKLEKMKSFTSEITKISMSYPSVKAGAESPLLRKAIELANAATEKHGITSSEAKLAWEDVEEIASAVSQKANADMPNLVDECLVEELEACQAIEELQRVLALSSQGDRYSG